MDRLLHESKEARERARGLDEDEETLIAELRSLKACHDPPTQEKAKQDEKLRLVHEDKEDRTAKPQALRAEKDELRDEVVEAEKQTRAALEEKAEIWEVQGEIDIGNEELKVSPPE